MTQHKPSRIVKRSSSGNKRRAERSRKRTGGFSTVQHVSKVDCDPVVRIDISQGRHCRRCRSLPLTRPHSTLSETSLIAHYSRQQCPLT
ncbi:hypothetical protein J6590_002827 [Homalodisca vitripennis]|nr:hypothetical protein J6590_002827 [Homalodisca vitripennis]